MIFELVLFGFGNSSGTSLVVAEECPGWDRDSRCDDGGWNAAESGILFRNTSGGVVYRALILAGGSVAGPSTRAAGVNPPAVPAGEVILGFCLPTEAEWDYACRAGSKGLAYFWEGGFDNGFRICRNSP